MRVLKVLTNNNIIDCAVLSYASYTRKEEQLTFKVVFNGEQRFKLSKKEIILYPDSFICMPSGTIYESTISAHEPIKTLSISISSDFLKDFQNRFFLPNFQ